MAPLCHQGPGVVNEAVFGRAHCPSCGAGFTVSEEAEGQWV